MRSVPFLPLLPVLLFAGGCSSEAGSAKGDASSDAVRDTTVDAAVDPAVDRAIDPPAAETAIPGCDPVAQSCGAGMKCEFDCPPPALSCIAAGTGAGLHGDPCTWPTCGKGTTCVTLTGSTVARCVKFCNGDADCPAGSGCQTLNLGCMAATPIPVKMCIQLSTDGGTGDI